jgi:hypothetical protein
MRSITFVAFVVFAYANEDLEDPSTFSSTPITFTGKYFTGQGIGNADEWLLALETARSQFSPNPILQDISMLYDQTWNGFVEGPTWGAWWTQNSYGTTLCSLPFIEEPLRSFIRNANAMWFQWEGNGTRVGLDDPNPAPDGCLCDAATPNGAYYKQGDGNVPIHDWALEETLSGVIMQAEQLLIERDIAASVGYYLPLFNRTLNLIESRRNATLDLFYSGDASNLLAPSYGAWLLENGTRVPAFLTGMSVSYIAALDRVIELELLASLTDPTSPWKQSADIHTGRRSTAIRGLEQLLEPNGQYFIKSLDPNGTRHGVLGQERYGYIEAVSNHDAVALDVAERVQPGLNEKIMKSLLGDIVPPNPKTGGPGLRPFSLVITNAGSLDDMEYDNSSYLWSFGTWVNGGEWATCEARMMLAYFRTGRLDFALDSWRALMGFASIYRMDSPLVDFGSAVYQPDDPINIVYDMFGIAAALLRGLWDPMYSSDAISISPHISNNISLVNSSVPIFFGQYKLYFSATGNSTFGIQSVTIQGNQWTNFTQERIIIPFQSLPFGSNQENVSIVITFGSSISSLPSIMSDMYNIQTLDKTSVKEDVPIVSRKIMLLHPSSRETATRALRARIPQDSLLWLDASTLSFGDGDLVDVWPDISGNSNNATQSDVIYQPKFLKYGSDFSLPGVLFDGNKTFLSNRFMNLTDESTIYAVFRDIGSTTDCCSGIFYSIGGCNGISTKVDETLNNARVLMIDWSGSGDGGSDDILNKQVIASIVYNASGAFSFADTCLQSQEGVVGAIGTGYMIGSRNDELSRFFNGTLSELLVFKRSLNASEMDSIHAYLSMKWPITGNPVSCSPIPPNCTLPTDLSLLSDRITKFVAGMRSIGQFADSLYELAHALLSLESITAWENRCNGLNNGTITPLSSFASEKAADASYITTAVNLCQGLSTVLNSYQDSNDEMKKVIWTIWNATG